MVSKSRNPNFRAPVKIKGKKRECIFAWECLSGYSKQEFYLGVGLVKVVEVRRVRSVSVLIERTLHDWRSNHRGVTSQIRSVTLMH